LHSGEESVVEVRILSGELSETDEVDFVRVRTCAAEEDDTVTLATIQRVVDKNNGARLPGPAWHVRTLIFERPMQPDVALGLATRYAERKGIRTVYTEGD
jgi:hypothetical protein